MSKEEVKKKRTQLPRPIDSCRYPSTAFIEQYCVRGDTRYTSGEVMKRERPINVRAVTASHLRGANRRRIRSFRQNHPRACLVPFVRIGNVRGSRKRPDVATS